MIHKIRQQMNYKGEVSDDEDSIIKYDETQDQLNEQIKKFNRKSIAFEARPNAKTEDQPMINNQEIITGKVELNDEEDSISEEDEISHKILKDFKEKKEENKNNYYHSEKGKRIIYDKIRNSKMPYYKVRLNNKDVKNYNNVSNNNKNLNNNNSNLNYINSHSQNNLMEDRNLFPNQNSGNNK